MDNKIGRILSLKFLRPFSQFLPENPNWHLQVYVPVSSEIHTPPLRQGADEHGSPPPVMLVSVSVAVSARFS